MKTANAIIQIRNELKVKRVKYCVGGDVDFHGDPKGKTVPIDHFLNFAHGSELYTGYALDGLGQSPKDDEIASLPGLDHITILPWNSEVAWMPADNTLKREPYEINTRVALKKQLAIAEEMGFRFNLGTECEIFALRLTEDARL